MQTFKTFRIRCENVELTEELRQHGLSIDTSDPTSDWCLLKLPTDHPGIRMIEEWLNSQGVEYECGTLRSFSRREIRSAPALHLDIAQVAAGPRAIHPIHKDWSDACERCMRTSLDSGPIECEPSILQNHILSRGPRGELIVSKKVAMRMVSDGISGAVLEPIWASEEHSESDPENYRIIPTDVLPRVTSPPTRFALSRDRCAVCGRGGLHLDSLLYFDAPIDTFVDINVTSEVFGDGRSLAPEVVVSPRFYNLLLSCGARDLTPEPVVLV